MLQSKLDQLLKLEAAGEGSSGSGDSGSQGAKGEAAPPSEGTKGEGDDQLDVEKLPESAKSLIKSLREENAKHRTKNKELGEGQSKLKKALVEAGIIEDDDIEPEEKIKGLSAEVHGAKMRNALLEAAMEHDVPKTQLKYFQFLITERLETLEEDGELSQDDIAEIAAEVKKTGMGGSGTKGAKSSAGTGSAPQAGGDGRLTQEQFDSMGILEKSELYVKQPEVYQQLFTASKALHTRR